MISAVSVDTLGGLGPRLGAGGQGEVFALPAHPQLLLKRYHPTTAINVDGLTALVDWPRTLIPHDRTLIYRATAWPTQLVRCENSWGVLVPRAAPGRFSHVVEQETVPRDLQFAYCTAARFAGVPPLGPAAGVVLVKRVAAVFDVLHRNNIVYGDLSATNALFSAGPRPTVLLIDCDSAWHTDHPRPLPAAQSPLWEDPWPSDGSPAAEQRRDLFKLALLFLRVHYHSQLVVDTQLRSVQIPADPLISREVADLLYRGLRRDGDRPAATEWITPLTRLERALSRRAAA